MNSTQLHVYIIDENNQASIADFVRLCDVTPVRRKKQRNNRFLDNFNRLLYKNV